MKSACDTLMSSKVLDSGSLHSTFRNVISHYRSRAMNSIMVNGRVTAEFG